MGDRKIITPEKFCDIWKEVWAAKWSVERDDILKKYSDRLVGGWTEYMLTDENSFLVCVAKGLGFQQNCEKDNYYKIEHDRVDMALMPDYRSGYPIMLDALIEHENIASSIANEMWKLILRRSPLKVTIFCSAKPEKNLTPCWNLLDNAKDAFPENEQTEYLFIIGALTDENEICWQWATNKERLPQNLC